MNIVKPLLAASFYLKGLKTWESSEGGGFQFTLTHHGKAVARVTEHGMGGPIDVEWNGIHWDGSIRSTASKAETRQAALSKVALEAFEAVLAATPPIKADPATGIPDDAPPLTPDEGWLMSALLEHVELAKLCAKKTAFRLPDDRHGTYRVFAEPYGPSIAGHIRKTYPTAVILNEEIATTVA
jgi:hypothetical protein